MRDFLAIGIVVLLFTTVRATEIATPKPDVALQSLASAQRSSLQLEVQHQPAIVVFWRTDCAPCRAELEQLANLREAAGKMRMLLVSVDDSIAEAPLFLRGIADSWYARDRPAHVLGMFGGDPPRLPLSVALDSDGRICAVRRGSIDPQLVARWVESCMSPRMFF